MSYKQKTDSLFLGLTRPPLILGVSYDFVLINILTCMILYVKTKLFKLMILAVPIHAVGYYFCSKEPLFIELFRINAQKCPKRRSYFYYHCNSYMPY